MSDGCHVFLSALAGPWLDRKLDLALSIFEDTSQQIDNAMWLSTAKLMAHDRTHSCKRAITRLVSMALPFKPGHPRQGLSSTGPGTKFGYRLAVDQTLRIPGRLARRLWPQWTRDWRTHSGCFADVEGCSGTMTRLGIPGMTSSRLP